MGVTSGDYCPMQKINKYIIIIKKTPLVNRWAHATLRQKHTEDAALEFDVSEMGPVHPSPVHASLGSPYIKVQVLSFHCVST